MNTQPKMYDYVMARLREKRIPQRALAKQTGVPFSTLAKIAQGYSKAPTIHHIQTLHDFFRAADTVPPAPTLEQKEAA